MKFVKLTALAMVLALFVCAFAACGGAEDTPAMTEPATDPVTEPVTEPETEPAHVHEIERVITEATCTSRGYDREICKTCEEVISTTPINAIDHVAKDGANCTTDAVCKFCDAVITKAPGHTLGEATVTKEATCEADGEKSMTCSVCNETVTETVAKLSHVIATVTDSKASTLTEAGYEKGVCSLCNKEVTNNTPAGVTLNIEALADGVLEKNFTFEAGIDAFYSTVDAPTTAIIEEKTALNGVPYEGAPGDWATVVTDPETGNKYITKTEGYPVDAGIFFEDADDVLTGATIEISFDYRCEGDTKNNGLVSLNNREVAKTDEMRILSLWSGNKIVFASNSSAVITKVDPTNPEWMSFRIIANTKNLTYEVYLNGVKRAYTELVDGKHTVYCLQDDGSWKSFTSGFGEQTPFHSDDGLIKGIYFWHYNYPQGSLDNIRFAILNPAE